MAILDKVLNEFNTKHMDTNTLLSYILKRNQSEEEEQSAKEVDVDMDAVIRKNREDEFSEPEEGSDFDDSFDDESDDESDEATQALDQIDQSLSTIRDLLGKG